MYEIPDQQEFQLEPIKNLKAYAKGVKGMIDCQV